MAGEIIDEFGDDVETVTLLRSDGGRFEVDVDGRSVFSKRATGRHANPGEVVDNIAKIQGAPTTYDGGAGDQRTVPEAPA